MFKMRCIVCGSTHAKKNGVRNGVQLYKCQNCGYRFRARAEVSEDELSHTPNLIQFIFLHNLRHHNHILRSTFSSSSPALLHLML